MVKSCVFIQEFEVIEPIHEHEKPGNRYILKTIKTKDEDEVEFYTFEGTNKYKKTLFFMLMHPQNYMATKICQNNDIIKINL